MVGDTDPARTPQQRFCHKCGNRLTCSVCDPKRSPLTQGQLVWIITVCALIAFVIWIAVAAHRCNVRERERLEKFAQESCTSVMTTGLDLHGEPPTEEWRQYCWDNYRLR